MAYNLEPRTIKENLLGLIGKNPHAEPRPANTREECFLADIAENGGGGGGLPPYTSADKGKVLTVGEGEPQTVVVVPEQTVTVGDFGGGITVTGEVNIGDSCILTVDGADYPVTVTSEADGLTCKTVYSGTNYDEFYMVVEGNDCIDPHFVKFDRTTGLPIPGTYTVSLTASVPSVEPKWESGVINVSGNPGSTLTPDKTYSEVVEAINNGIIPVAVLGGGSLILQYSGKSGDTLNFQCLTANTSVGGTIEGLTCFSGAYSEANGFTVAQYTVSF